MAYKSCIQKLHSVNEALAIFFSKNTLISRIISGSLQIMNSQETDQGKYECVAENSKGTEYSYSAQLYVRGKNLIFLTASVAVAVYLFKSCSCYDFCKNNSLSSFLHFLLIQLVKLSTFVHISNITTSQTASLRSFILVRRVKPHFTIPPSPEYESMLGASLNITCVAVGSPMPHVKWRRVADGKDLQPPG